MILGRPKQSAFLAIANNAETTVRRDDIGDYIMCDADNSKWLNGWEPDGCYLGQDYDEFQSWFGSKFNTMWTINGFPNEGSLVNWMESHSNISNYAIYLTSNWSWADIDNFAGWAYQAGFLGQYQLLKQARYVCQRITLDFHLGLEGSLVLIMESGTAAITRGLLTQIHKGRHSAGCCRPGFR